MNLDIKKQLLYAGSTWVLSQEPFLQYDPNLYTFHSALKYQTQAAIQINYTYNGEKYTATKAAADTDVTGGIYVVYAWFQSAEGEKYFVSNIDDVVNIFPNFATEGVDGRSYWLQVAEILRATYKTMSADAHETISVADKTFQANKAEVLRQLIIAEDKAGILEPEPTKTVLRFNHTNTGW